MMFEPTKRITVEEALRHPYLANLHLEEDEPIREPMDPLDFEFEQHNLTMQQLKGICDLTQICCTRRSYCTTTRSSARTTRNARRTSRASSVTSSRTATAS